MRSVQLSNNTNIDEGELQEAFREFAAALQELAESTAMPGTMEAAPNSEKIIEIGYQVEFMAQQAQKAAL